MNLNTITFGAPEEFNVLVEISEGSNLKYEFDEKSGELKLDFVFKGLVFPFNYGFIPHTMGGDNDPLDVIILSSAPLKSGQVVKCKPIGILKTIDRGEVDDKIITVPVGDRLDMIYKDIGDIPPGSLEKWTEFYKQVAIQKNKSMQVTGIQNKQAGIEEIKKALK